MGYDGTLKFDTSIDSSGFQDGANKISSIAGTALKATGASLAAASAAVAALVKKSVDAYGNYEQLVGGVETLFGAGGKSLEEYADSIGKSVEDAKAKYESLMTAQETVMNNAANAYKNAGMSANEYMENVTSFAASLVSGLGGDTEAAAKAADVAITDMSDNANKMGTDIGRITDAYQGFAKQNYTMLDNLKLGYGGTASEMARLINDSGVLGDTMEVTAKTVNEVSFDKIVEAIHVVQDRMGITGTTAKEAASTIQGSFAMAGAAWDNLLAGMGDKEADLNSLVSEFVDSVATVGKNLLPVAETALKSIASVIEELAPVIAERLPVVLADILPDLLSAGAKLIEGIGSGVINAAPTLFSAGLDLIGNLTEGIRSKLPDLIPIAMDALVNFSGTLRENAGQLVDAGLSLIMSLADSLIENIPVFIETIPTIVSNIAGIINDNAPKLLASGLELIGKLALGLIQAIPTLVANIPQIISAILDTFMAFNWVSIGQNIITLVTNGVKNLAKSIPSAIKEIGKTAVEWLKAIDWRTLGRDVIDLIVIGVKALASSIPNALKAIGTSAVNLFKSIDWGSVGRNIIYGIGRGLSNALGWLWDLVSNLCGNLLNYIKRWFGISSPSKVFADEVGEWIPPGIGKGMEKAMPGLIKDAEGEMDMLASKMQAAVNVETGRIAVDKNISQTYKVERENGQSFDDSKTEVLIEGETHVHVDLDKKEVGDATTPIIDKNMARIDTHKKRGG